MIAEPRPVDDFEAAVPEDDVCLPTLRPDHVTGALVVNRCSGCPTDNNRQVPAFRNDEGAGQEATLNLAARFFGCVLEHAYGGCMAFILPTAL